MNFREALAFLYEQLPAFHRIGAPAYKANLDNTVALCKLLDNPQDRFPSIHVAGTNGKGSVSHMLASILQEKGLKTGLYTSPHLKDFRERIRIRGEMIPENAVTDFVEKYKGDMARIGLSFFEMTAGMAFDHFRNEGVDIAVIETGLGGRLDSTNIITPLLSVITNISYDHMQFLGNTLEQIAAEKAGIIKHRIPVVIGETREETATVFRKVAALTGSGILFSDSVYSVHPVESTPDRHLPGPGSSSFLTMDVFRHGDLFIRNLTSPLTGHYQMKNIVTVMGVCEMLENSPFAPGKANIAGGIRNVIRNTGFAGRWQILSRAPLTICDTGHNVSGLQEVVAQIGTIGYDHLHFVFGLVVDKDAESLLRLLPADATCYFCKADIPRGMDAGILLEKALRIGLKGKAYGSVREAFDAARAEAGPGDLVFVGGSTFVVAEVL